MKKNFKKIEKLLSDGHFTGGRKKGLQKWKGSENIKYMGLANSPARIYVKFENNEYKKICGYFNKGVQQSISDRVVDTYDNNK